MTAFIEWIQSLSGTVWGTAGVWFGGVWAVTATLWRVSKDADEELDPERRKDLGDQLTNLDRESFTYLVSNITLFFDRLFGIKHFSWRCFAVSAAVSCSAFVIIFLFLEESGWGAVQENPFMLVLVVAMAMFSNVLSDYISLLETRFLLQSKLPHSIKLCADVLATYLVTVFVSALCMPIFVLFSNWLWGFPFEGYPSLVREIFLDLVSSKLFLFDSGGDLAIMQTIVITGYTTSIWLWLHALAELAIRFLSRWVQVIQWLNVKKNPLRAIGLTTNLLIWLLGLLGFPIYWHFRG